MRKIFCFLLLLMMLIPNFILGSAAEGDVTSNANGFQNISFSNGYQGFCLDQKLASAYQGDTFESAGTGSATSNLDGRDISQQLKILFTQCFNDLFVSNGNGWYYLNDANTVQAIVYHLTDNAYIYGKQRTLLNQVNAYSGPAIPDNGYVLTLENGDQITFYFMVLKSQKEGTQDFFAYCISVKEASSHEHDYSKDWKSDEEEHWHECDCGDKKDLNDHKETIVGDKAPGEFDEGYTGDKVCENCDKVLQEGEIIPPTHEHEFSKDWKSDDEEHWHECDCGEKEDIGNHKETIVGAKEPGEFDEGYTGDKVCKDCGKLLDKGESIPPTHEHAFSKDWKFDDEEHWHECDCGEKEDIGNHKETIVGDKAPGEFDEGYTGDKVCEDCDRVLQEGEIIPPTHKHDYSKDWKSDDEEHWHECDCGEKEDAADHTFNNGKCTVCQKTDPNYESTSPSTGDESAVMLCAALAVMSLFGIAWITCFARKNGMI